MFVVHHQFSYCIQTNTLILNYIDREEIIHNLDLTKNSTNTENYLIKVLERIHLDVKCLKRKAGYATLSFLDETYTIEHLLSLLKHKNEKIIFTSLQILHLVSKSGNIYYLKELLDYDILFNIITKTNSHNANLFSKYLLHVFSSK